MGFKLNSDMTNRTIKLNGINYNQETLEKLYLANEPETSWRNAIYYFLQNWFDDSDFILAQTSGSTDKPKSIRLHKTSMINSARMTNQFFGLNAGSTALLCLPASYIAGKMMLVRALVGGFNLITVEPSANPFEKMDQSIDFTAITPYQLFHSVESLRTKQVLKIIVGGSPVTGKLEQLSENIPSELYETYGMTETCSHIALRRFNGTGKSEYFSVLEGVTIRQDERDCLAIHAPHLLNDEIQTNDVVELIANNSFRWLGRADSVINSGGIKIHPEKVEKKLEGIIPTSYFISSVPDEEFENKVILIIESEKYGIQEEAILMTKMQNLLDKFELPKQISYIPRFIYSAGNKVLRKETLVEAQNS
ncbi:AMP-binding protein [Flavobacterium sp. UBA6031]|uniref:AMP-binding protein n=1 Tax=Flavobacterium sp. UBA6031 TaxID=1946551 RepID=UPI0025C0031A|nr:AMP-binding protein [Flavobacterium sp. UBA6031]